MLCHASGFEDIDYWVQLTGLNKQKTGPNSGGIFIINNNVDKCTPAHQHTGTPGTKCIPDGILRRIP